MPSPQAAIHFLNNPSTSTPLGTHSSSPDGKINTGLFNPPQILLTSSSPKSELKKSSSPLDTPNCQHPHHTPTHQEEELTLSPPTTTTYTH